jgi:hypothetical protein
MRGHFSRPASIGLRLRRSVSQYRLFLFSWQTFCPRRRAEQHSGSDQRRWSLRFRATGVRRCEKIAKSLFTTEAQRRRAMKPKGVSSVSQCLSGEDRIFSQLLLPVMFMAGTCPDEFDRDGHATLLVAAAPRRASVVNPSWIAALAPCTTFPSTFPVCLSLVTRHCFTSGASRQSVLR